MSFVMLPDNNLQRMIDRFQTASKPLSMSRCLLLLLVIFMTVGCRNNVPITTLSATTSGQIVYRGESGTLDTFIYIINPDGSNLMRLRGESFVIGDWSNDGSHILYTEHGASDREIMTLDVGLNVRHRITSNGADDSDGNWSPDGTQIVFESDRNGGNDLYIMDADGSNPTQLTFIGNVSGSPVWSPDGSRIAFVVGTIYDTSQIYSINVDGTHLINLTTSSGSNPQWSPDGSQIIFTTSDNDNVEIYIMNADGSNPINLTNNEASDWSGEWSPDGSQIVFSSRRNGGLDIYVMNADGSDQRHVAEGWGAVWRP